MTNRYARYSAPLAFHIVTMPWHERAFCFTCYAVLFLAAVAVGVWVGGMW